MNLASNHNYRGPVDAAVECSDGTTTYFDLKNWHACHNALNNIAPDKVAGVYVNAPIGGWGGEAVVRGLMGTHNVYTQKHEYLADAKVELKALVNAAEMQYAEQTASPAAELAALKVLDARDPYRHMSDDFRVWSTGEVLNRRIKALEAQL
jgi:hypothetical protein